MTMIGEREPGPVSAHDMMVAWDGHCPWCASSAMVGDACPEPDGREIVEDDTYGTD